MKIDLSAFLEKDISSLPLSGKLELGKTNFNGRNINFIEPVTYEGEIYRVADDKYIHLDISYLYEESCGRCLEDFRKNGKAKLTGKMTSDREEIENNEEEEFVYFKDIDNIDLSKDIKGMILLSLPMKPLCSEECAGLCQVCGIDLNKDSCQCVVDKVDPRLAALKDFVPED